jgi:CubicO group peptidase (beta-lactamase class C family)
MQALQDVVDEAAARTGFSGVVRVDRSGETEFASAYGFADRAHRIRNTVETQFGIASGTKGLTAVVVMGLVERRLRHSRWHGRCRDPQVAPRHPPPGGR